MTMRNSFATLVRQKNLCQGYRQREIISCLLYGNTMHGKIDLAYLPQQCGLLVSKIHGCKVILDKRSPFLSILCGNYRLWSMNSYNNSHGLLKSCNNVPNWMFQHSPLYPVMSVMSKILFPFPDDRTRTRRQRLTQLSRELADPSTRHWRQKVCCAFTTQRLFQKKPLAQP